MTWAARRSSSIADSATGLAEPPALCTNGLSVDRQVGADPTLTVGNPAMYAVYVLEDTWRLRATFSTRDAADSLVARLVSRGVRAKLFRAAETQRRAA